MRNQQRKGKVFLALACLIMLACLAQRITLLHAIQLPVTQPVLVAPTNNTLDGLSSFELSPCQLSAHALLIAPPVLFDYALPILMTLLAIFALQGKEPSFFPKIRAASSPVLRIHLKNCVFRE